MASPLPRLLSSFCSSFEGWFCTLFDMPTEVMRDGYAAGDLPSARDEHPNQGILDVAKASPRMRRQDSEECTLQLNTELRPPAEPSVPILILDSGASRHAAGDMALFMSPFREVTPKGSAAPAYYQGRDGSRLAVAGIGTISYGNFYVSDVLYVPGLCTKAIHVSVQQLAERDYSIVFGGGQCYIKEPSSGELVGKGRLHDDDALYHLEFLMIPPDEPATNTNRARQDPA